MKRSKSLPIINNDAGAGVTEADTAKFRPQPSTPEEALALPDLHEVELDWDGVDCVLADLDDFADIVQIQLRNASGDAQSSSCIVAARDSLRSGEAQGMQIVYAFAERQWCDTLLRGRNGARLLRMEDPRRVD